MAELFSMEDEKYLRDREEGSSQERAVQSPPKSLTEFLQEQESKLHLTRKACTERGAYLEGRSHSSTDHTALCYQAEPH